MNQLRSESPLGVTGEQHDVAYWPRAADHAGAPAAGALALATNAMGGDSTDHVIKSKWKGNVLNSRNGNPKKIHGYAPVNGLKMYYEIEGTGDPLVYIPPAFGFAGMRSFPTLVQNHSIITTDLQGNGRTADIPERPISIEQCANDVVGLLTYLGTSKADFFGESYGAPIAAMIAVRHPEIIGRVAIYSATFGLPQKALNPETTHFDKPPTAESGYIRFQRESYKKVAPYPNYWPKIFDKVVSIQWNGFSKEELAAIKAPILIVVGDHDFVCVERAVSSLRTPRRIRTSSTWLRRATRRRPMFLASCSK
jgi:pimeloyl-ACP methyl ester carboxylesterase